MRFPVRQNGFLIALVLMIPLGALLSEAGSSGGFFRPEITVKAGVFIIFLMQGLSLPSEKLRAGLFRWQLHAFCQSWNFLLFPLMVIILLSIFGPFLEAELRGGLLFLAILPTTVSSAIIFTESAGGDTSGALFNTALSNMLGVFFVPLWCLFLFATDGVSLPPVRPLLIELSLLILLPTLLGQGLRPFTARFRAFAQPSFKHISNAIICFAVFTAFANSFAQSIWDDMGWALTIQALLGTTALLLLATILCICTSRLSWLRFAKDARIAAVFCGSQKTIAAGVPMASVIFGGEAGGEVALLLIPLLIYHPLQLVLGAFLIERFRSEPT